MTPANKPPQLTHEQLYLATNLRETVPGWLGLTNPAIGKLNQRFGSTVVGMALGRAREEEVPAATSAFRLLESICMAVAEEQP